jgi:hypothetical protein
MSNQPYRFLGRPELGPIFGTLEIETTTTATRKASPSAFCTTVQNAFETRQKHRKM